jgi:hypothetical protein
MARVPDGRRNLMREQLAHRAARIMAEDGIEDFAVAKRKAARQSGVPETRHLPNDDEVEDALRTYRLLYEDQEHRSRMRFLRETAARAMREFSRFRPRLVGSVLSGSAGRSADVNLQLFTDNAKEVEHYLLDRHLEYRQSDQRLQVGDRMRTLQCLVLTGGDVFVILTVFPVDDLHRAVRRSPAGRPLARGTLEDVLALLDDGSCPSPVDAAGSE